MTTSKFIDTEGEDKPAIKKYWTPNITYVIQKKNAKFL